MLYFFYLCGWRRVSSGFFLEFMFCLVLVIRGFLFCCRFIFLVNVWVRLMLIYLLVDMILEYRRERRFIGVLRVRKVSWVFKICSGRCIYN